MRKARVATIILAAAALAVMALPVAHADSPNFHYATARYLLNPVTKVELTARTGVRCPHCGSDLVAWLRPEDPAKSEIVCTAMQPHYDAPNRWPESEWKRLGVLAGVHDDSRFGARLPYDKLVAEG